ncbi:MAG: hypothetical protein ACT4R6_00580 [Gemmatimonadaceae bacterium]
MTNSYLIISMVRRHAPRDFVRMGEVRPGTISGGRAAGGGAP